jgi:hypothetical protein
MWHQWCDITILFRPPPMSATNSSVALAYWAQSDKGHKSFAPVLNISYRYQSRIFHSKGTMFAVVVSDINCVTGNRGVNSLEASIPVYSQIKTFCLLFLNNVNFWGNKFTLEYIL